MAELYSQYTSGAQLIAGTITGSSFGISGINPIVDRLNSITSDNNLIICDVSGTNTMLYLSGGQFINTPTNNNDFVNKNYVDSIGSLVVDEYYKQNNDIADLSTSYSILTSGLVNVTSGNVVLLLFNASFDFNAVGTSYMSFTKNGSQIGSDFIITSSDNNSIQGMRNWVEQVDTTESVIYGVQGKFSVLNNDFDKSNFQIIVFK